VLLIFIFLPRGFKVNVNAKSLNAMYFILLQMCTTFWWVWELNSVFRF
jgi:hypothetical protein